MRPEVRMECDELSKAPAMASATYHSNSKARLISAVTEDVLGGTLTESYTYNFPGDVTNHTTSYTHGTVTDALSITYDYDSCGRMTYDGASGVTIDYNYLNLTRKISGTG